MKWLNALGLLLQFLAFWFAAPELLGAATLKRFESGLRRFIRRIPMLIGLCIILSYALYFGIQGFMKGLEASENGVQHSEIYSFYIQLGIAFIVYIVFMIFYKRIIQWMDLKLAQPLTEMLINNNQTRKISLIIGAVFFSIGFLLQFFVILLN